jgi:hypothetical protein
LRHLTQRDSWASVQGFAVGGRHDQRVTPLESAAGISAHFHPVGHGSESDGSGFLQSPSFAQKLTRSVPIFPETQACERQSHGTVHAPPAALASEVGVWLAKSNVTASQIAPATGWTGFFGFELMFPHVAAMHASWHVAFAKQP